jgi:hypothetical protein
MVARMALSSASSVLSLRASGLTKHEAAGSYLGSGSARPCEGFQPARAAQFDRLAKRAWQRLGADAVAGYWDLADITAEPTISVLGT